MSPPPGTITANFSSLGIAPALLQILVKRNLTTPTPIQQQSIPSGLEGKDLVGIAQTGTGKTLAFGIPMLQRLAGGKGRGLVIVPTRELAEQVEQALRPFSTALGIRLAVLIGGVPYQRQFRMIRDNPRIIIATPGRLNDHMEKKTITLKEVSVLVLDEADRMLDMGFRPQLNRILAHVPRERQTMLFSATMPSEIMEIARKEMRLPLRVEVAPSGTAAAQVTQELFVVRQEHKLALLCALLAEHRGSVLVFSRTKHGAKKMVKSVRDQGHSAAEIHANRSLSQRREALEGFKRGKYRVLVATDIAARGIDVADIALVINYDLPNDAYDYVHRIGRTARAGRAGMAISFATPSQAQDVASIERLIRTQIPRKSHPSIAPGVLPSARSPSSGHRPQHYGPKRWKHRPRRR